jgi:chromosome segregation ATPase
MAGEGEGFPSILQSLIYIGSGIAVALATLIGGRKKGGESTSERDDRLAAIEQELADRKEIDSIRREREHTERDMAALRHDIEENARQVIKAMREPIERQIATIELQVADITRQIAGLKAQVGRLSRKQPK